MLKLSVILKDNLLTNSQKHSEIEKSKFLLFSFCTEQMLSIIEKNKGSISQKE